MSVVVVTGAGGMGQAVVRRIGSGSTIVLADASDAALAQVGDALRADGHAVETVRTDITSADDVAALARAVADLGQLRCVVHTAGVSPVQATTSAPHAYSTSSSRTCNRERSRCASPAWRAR
jgi:NAD(P)-dependent dehydrogenase (short-subunit alcohol dehydrogenase family)